MTTQEHLRLQEIDQLPPGERDKASWRRWGPYLSDRSWSGVREDYSSNGDAWGYFPHDMARSRAYRWGEDGIAGICDRYQVLCFAPAFWNEHDPILKERYFGLTPHEGNHGEDVKEYYFHVDNTPTHSYMKLLYKYPHAAYPYEKLITENKARNGQGYEYELLDTGIFDENRYFDIEIEYAKAATNDICIRITAFNRGPEAAPLHVLPHVWYRNTWGWTCEASDPAKKVAEPIIRLESGKGTIRLVADDETLVYPATIPTTYRLGKHVLTGPASGAALFTDNETHAERAFGKGAKSRKPYVKDAFHRYIVHGEKCINPAQTGTKAALQYRYIVPANGSVVLRLRLTPGGAQATLDDVDAVVAKRKAEADEFYNAIHPPKATDDEKLVQRQAFAGLLWTKQSYIFDVHTWQKGDCDKWPPSKSRKHIRNHHWKHLNSLRVMSMPDKWEYPWFAAWDLAFHTVTFALIDPDFAKDQLWMLLFEQFQHPNGQIPAYEWEFSDLNPPVHAWAVWQVYYLDRFRSGKPDRAFLEKCYHKLLINFAWWINKVDSEGNNLFEGGFLGLDNITVVDRSIKPNDGSVLEQADATGWMGMFCLNLMRIALELAADQHDDKNNLIVKGNPVYEGLATKFFQHYTYVANAMKKMGGRNYSLWDETDGFFYDVLRHRDGRFNQFRVRSLVGLIPLFAVQRLDVKWITENFKQFTGQLHWFLEHRKDLVKDVVHTSRREDGAETYVLTIVNDHQLERMLQRMWDETEFLSPYGVRSLSKYHEGKPFWYGDNEVGYEPAEAVSKIKGGNSNWRGPIWFPTSFLLIQSLYNLGRAYGSTFTVKTQAASGAEMTFHDMAQQFADRLISIFTRDKTGRRPVFGGSEKFQNDPYWRDHVLFYEYFHGDNGAGLGASHQTGWTALVASLIDEWRGK